MAPVATGILTVVQDGFGVCVRGAFQRSGNVLGCGLMRPIPPPCSLTLLYYAAMPEPQEQFISRVQVPSGVPVSARNTAA